MAVFTGNGSNTAPSFTFSSNTNTGFFRNGSNNIGVAANSTHVAGFQASGAHFYVTGTGTAASPNFGIVSTGRPNVAISGANDAISISNGDLARFGSSATDTAISLATQAATGTTSGSAAIRFFPAQNGSVWAEVRGGRDGNFGSASTRDTNLIFLTGENESAPDARMKISATGAVTLAGDIFTSTRMRLNSGDTGLIEFGQQGVTSTLVGDQITVPTSTTRTVTIAGLSYGFLDFQIGGYIPAGGGYCHLQIQAGGYMTATTAYNSTTPINARGGGVGAITVNKNSSNITFNLTNNSTTQNLTLNWTMSYASILPVTVSVA